MYDVIIEYLNKTGNWLKLTEKHIEKYEYQDMKNWLPGFIEANYKLNVNRCFPKPFEYRYTFTDRKTKRSKTVNGIIW